MSAPLAARSTRLFIVLAAFFAANAVIAGFVGVKIFALEPTLGLPANPEEVASDVSPPWYFSPAYMWITLLPKPVALWTLLGGAGLFVAYPFVDRILSQRGWSMPLMSMRRWPLRRAQCVMQRTVMSFSIA